MYRIPPHTSGMEITPEPIYRSRREWLKALSLGAVALTAGCESGAAPDAGGKAVEEPIPGKALAVAERGQFVVAEPMTRYKDATHYNNFYEFGTGKSDPAQTSAAFHAQPWSVEIAGNAEVTGRFTLEDLLKPHPLEERVYRMRCVEGWSMVIPWVGIGLGDVLKRFKPTSNAKFIVLTTVNRPAEMPGMRSDILDWPYREGLRIDEAMHPLTLLAVGMYGHELPNQNGAPLRLVVPWKYGFKGVKSIVKIKLVEEEPQTTWNLATPSEYGFYANVKPAVDHPRWSQETERRIGDLQRRPTLMFNGYANEVASLYAGMDLRKHY